MSPRDPCVKILHKLQGFHVGDHARTRKFSRKVSERCQISVKRLMWWLFSHKIHSWLFVVVLQERKGQGNQMKKDHPTSLQTEWDEIALRVRSNFSASMRSVFMSSNMLETGPLLKRKKGGRGGIQFKNGSDHHRRLVNLILACNQLFVAVKS